MEHNPFFVLVAAGAILFASCGSHHANNLNISQSNRFERSKNRYFIETKLTISNRFGIAKNTSIWEDETSDKSSVDQLLKKQRNKADSVCNQYK